MREAAMQSAPTWGAPNLAICVPGLSCTAPWSCLMVDAMPDLGLMGGGTQTFPLWRYALDPLLGLRRIDNIETHVVRRYAARYGDDRIAALDIFFHVYGCLHHAGYARRYAANLFRELPRVSLPPAFWPWREAGQALGHWHCHYDTLDPWPLRAEPVESGRELAESDFRLGRKRMRWESGRTALRLNPAVRVTGIPPEALEWMVAGKTALDWQIAYLRVRTDRRSGIVNDANAKFVRPSDIVPYLGRVCRSAVETARLRREIATWNLGLPAARESRLAGGAS